jgi:hypothetical protein
MDDVAPKSIPSSPGYFADQDGNIYSAWTGSGRGARIGGDLKRLEPIAQRDARLVVNLSTAKGRVRRRVSALILETFVGPRPKGYEACHFPDRDPSNNKLSNLRWDSKAGNQADRVVHGTSNHGRRNGSAKLTIEQVAAIRGLCADGMSKSAAARKFGVSRSNIQQICNHQTWGE